MSPKDENLLSIPQEWPGAHYYDQEEVDAVTRVVLKKSPFRFYGPDHQREADQFEEEFAKYIGVNHCLGVSSGTTALQVAMAAMDIGPGDEVLLPGYFWVSTVSAVIRSGAIPKLVDVDDSFSLDPIDLKKKITDKSKLVVMVHMGGVIGHVKEVAKICLDNDLLLLEDCAQAGGASQFGKKAGSFGDMSIFSFQLNKNFTSGEGGAILTNSKEYYNKSFAIHDLGYARNEDGRLNFENPDFQRWGIGCRMNELVAAILRVQLKKLDTILTSMRSMKNELVDLISEYKGIRSRPVQDRSGDGGAFLMMTFDSVEQSKKFFKGLTDNGIQAMEGGMNPVHMTDWGLHIYFNVTSLVNKTSICGHHSVWEQAENAWAADYTYAKGSLPVLDDMVDRTVLFCIPSKLTPEQKAGLKEVFVQNCNELI